MNIQELLYRIGTSVQNAHAAIEEHTASHFFEHYFEPAQTEKSTDSFAPKMIKIELPSCNGIEGKTVCAPLAALVPQTSLHMDSVKVKLNLKVLDESNDCFEVSASDTDAAAENSPAGELEITYKCIGSPEGMARINTQLNSML
ncbi:MAG: DUF2589 domain-containing protein [Lachnospiraceae bacterium]|nr:DUF2589 domain-containing protein [Lachnospiraceae bacterium]